MILLWHLMHALRCATTEYKTDIYAGHLFLDFRDQAAAWAQARWTAWISSGVGWRGTPG